MIIIYPFLIKFEVKFNLLKLKGQISIVILNKFVFLYKFRIKNGYVYIYHKQKERKEKITNQNVNIIFFVNLINQLYFREQLLTFSLNSNFGYNPDACTTATISGFIDVLFKCVMSKIKNNKKSSHIFVEVEPKYNEDIFNAKLTSSIRISIFDCLYALLYAKFYVWRDYERKRKCKIK